MSPKVHGIHHVTAMAGDPQQNVDFYAGILGLRMVKKTVNFDDPFTYHFYYGDDAGNPGSIMTFFPWSSAGMRGRIGNGQLSVTSFAVPEGSLAFWEARLKAHRVQIRGISERFSETVLSFDDPDGLLLELVSSPAERRPGWENGSIPADHAIRGFYSVTLSLAAYERTAGLMTSTLGYQAVEDADSRFRYESGTGGPGTYVDLFCQPSAPRGTMGVGAVHHVAWRINDDESQLQLRRELLAAGYQVSPVMDRNYFHSIYFREPGGVLFEVATDPPGFAVDEPAESLGQSLKLPPWLEKERALIEQNLTPVTVRKP